MSSGAIGCGVCCAPVPAVPTGPSILSMSGLAGGEARPGNHAAIAVLPPPNVSAWSFQAWGVGSYGDTTYGTANHPDDYGASDGATLLWDGRGEDGSHYRASAPIRHDAGTGPFIGNDQLWIVDDDALDFDGAASGPGLTFSYSATGLPSGGGIDPVTGQGTGRPQAVESGVATVTATDQYGRTYQDSFTWTTAYRTVATAAADLPGRNFLQGAAVDLDLRSGFIPNGNTLSYEVAGLPPGLVDDGDGTISGTIGIDSGSDTIAITATDEYGRQVASAFSYTVETGILIAADSDNTLSVTWNGVADSISVSGGTMFDGSYSAWHDGTALDSGYVDGVAGRALAILPVTGMAGVGQTLTAGDALVLYADGQAEPVVTVTDWLRDDVAIPNASGRIYTLTADDEGAVVRPVYGITALGMTDVTETGRGVDVASGGWSVSDNGDGTFTIGGVPAITSGRDNGDGTFTPVAA